MIIHVELGENSYNITLEHGLISHISELIDTKRRVLIVTDSGVPSKYAERVASQCAYPEIAVISQGEKSKTLDTYSLLLERMLDCGFNRGDCVIAVGGGVVGDLSGFVAACYMRGVDFYNVPTTLLSQVDSSVGGKTAVNFGGIKNIVGVFSQPKAVLIDPDVLESLPPRQFSSGMAEAIKMSLTSDSELFNLIASGTGSELDRIIAGAIKIKRDVVQRDEREGGLRRILNFGHTIGHGIESVEQPDGLYHGECVSLGMLPMCSESVRRELIPVLRKYNLPVEYHGDLDTIFSAMRHDKKSGSDGVTVVTVPRIGEFEMHKETESALRQRLGMFV